MKRGEDVQIILWAMLTLKQLVCRKLGSGATEVGDELWEGERKITVGNVMWAFKAQNTLSCI